jgi:hypothetical protein
VQQTGAVTVDKVIPRITFNGKPSNETTYSRHVFNINGSIVVSNEAGDTMTIGALGTGVAITGPTIELYYDAVNNIVAYKIYKGTAIIWMFFRFNSDPYKVNIEITGMIPVSVQLTHVFTSNKTRWVFGNMIWFGTPNPVDPTFPKSAVGFDWSDISSQKAFDSATNTLRLTVGTQFILDPSTVNTTSQADATENPHERKCFYIAGRFWVFYSDGTNVVYSTSTDGVSWTVGASSPIRNSSDGYDSTWFYDGTYLHYAVARGGANLFYRRGYPNSNGSISWSAAEQTAKSGGTSVDALGLCVDSNGYPWISYVDTAATTYPWVTKSSKNDGTWTTDTGFPYQLSATSNIYWLTILVALLSDKVFVIYTNGSTLTKGQLYSAGWGAEETLTPDTLWGQRTISATAIGNDIHVVYYNTDGKIQYVKRTYGVGWSSPHTVESTSSGGQMPVISYNTANNSLYVFWLGYPTANHVYYKKCVSGVWDASETDWLTETSVTGLDRINCMLCSMGGYIGVCWMTGTSNPYNVRFGFIIMPLYNVAANYPKRYIRSGRAAELIDKVVT